VELKNRGEIVAKKFCARQNHDQDFGSAGGTRILARAFSHAPHGKMASQRLPARDLRGILRESDLRVEAIGGLAIRER